MFLKAAQNRHFPPQHQMKQNLSQMNLTLRVKVKNQIQQKNQQNNRQHQQLQQFHLDPQHILE